MVAIQVTPSAAQKNRMPTASAQGVLAVFIFGEVPA